MNRTDLRRLFSHALGLMGFGLLLSSTLLLTDWLREREQVAAGPVEVVVHDEPGAPAAPEPVDPRVRTFLDPGVPYGRPRTVAFGADRALFASGLTREPPEEVFARMLGTLERGVTRRGVKSLLARTPDAAALLRMQAHLGRIGEVAFFLRMPPDLGLVPEGRVRLEPGGIVLAYPAPDHWEYVCFYFPQGLDLDRFVAGFGAPKEALAPLGAAARDDLEPMLRVGGDRTGPATVICRAAGPAGAAMDRVARRLEGSGWRVTTTTRGTGGGERGREVRVCDGPDRRVWMATEERERPGGVVTVLVGGP